MSKPWKAIFIEFSSQKYVKQIHHYCCFSGQFTTLYPLRMLEFFVSFLQVREGSWRPYYYVYDTEGYSRSSHLLFYCGAAIDWLCYITLLAISDRERKVL